MENEKVNKQSYITMILSVVIFILGLGLGIVIGMNIEKTEKVDNQHIEENTNTQDVTNQIAETSNTTTVPNNASTEEIYKPKLSKEDRKKTALAVTMSTEEKEQLKATVEKDEADYGNDYQKLTSYQYFKRQPDRIYFKSPKVEGFYKFEKDDENYAHLFEVSEDRMSYSVIEDFNLYCFTPDSISTMMTSGDNYIIFDYDNKDLEEGDADFQKPLVFRFNTNTRLFRLATSLSCNKDLILVEDLDKKEFATNTKLSGYKYIMEYMKEVDN